MTGGDHHPVTGPSLYALLGLPSTATPQELRQAFRSLSKLYHPDTTTLPLPEAENQFRRLQEAYLILGDPERRRAYDSQLRLALLQRIQALSGSGGIPVAVPMPPLTVPPPPGMVPSPRPQSVRRALSGGEWFALVLLGVALLFSLVLGVGLAWWRGVELVGQPLSRAGLPDPSERQTAPLPEALPGDEFVAPKPDPPVQPPAAGPGAVAV